MDKNKEVVLVLFLVLLTSTFAIAQSNNVERTAQQVEGATRTLIDLFGKKKDKQNADQNIVQQSKGGGGVFKAGAISSSAKYIECDYMESFNKGAALIRKGTSYALINAAGQFIVPFGKFTAIATNFHSNDGSLKETGFFYATYKDQTGKVRKCFINTQGKVVYEIGDEETSKFMPSKDKKFLLFVPNKSLIASNYDYMFAISQEGNKHTLTQTANFRFIPDKLFADSMFIYGDKIGDQVLLGFKDINNKVIMKPRFNSIEPFSDGVAIIGVLDDLGKMKYGVVDKKGKVLIDPVFQYKPRDFGSGVSLVNSKIGNINSVFINKTGKVMLQQTEEFIAKYGSILRKSGKLFFTKKSVIDTLGNITSKMDYLNSLRFSSSYIDKLKEPYFNFDEDSYDGQIRLRLTVNYINQTGLLNVAERKIIYGLFERVPDALMLDPYSKLFHAVINYAENKFTEGFMNTSGEFVIVKKPTAYTGL